MYYLFGGRSWASNPARLIQASSIKKHGLWWDDGTSFDAPPQSPVTAKLKPYDDRNPDMSAEVSEVYKVKVPLFRDDLVVALKTAGIDNLELYDAEITDPDSGQVYTNYKAVNIIGLVAKTDIDKSDAIVHDGISLVDISVDKRIIDKDKTHDMLLFRMAENNGAILIHESVRDHLIKAGFTKLEFYNLEEVAL